jgi:hypothetical protein
MAPLGGPLPVQRAKETWYSTQRDAKKRTILGVHTSFATATHLDLQFLDGDGLKVHD